MIGHAFSFTIASGLVLAAMYLIYKLLLANQKQLAYNRAILLAIYVLAPAITAIYGLTKSAATNTGLSTAAINGTIDFELPTATIIDAGSASAPLWATILLYAWLAGMAVMVLTTIAGQIRLVHIIKKSDVSILADGRKLRVVEREDIAPFSFGNTIVMSRADWESSAKMIIIHESRHLDLHHTIDLVAARLVIIVNWFNPAAWLMAEELRSVHEFQADMAVLRSGVDARQYQLLLIKKAVGKSFPAIANSLNHSNLKKRITMMIKSNQSKSRRLRALALVPAAAAAILVTNIPAVASAITAISDASLTGHTAVENLAIAPSTTLSETVAEVTAPSESKVTQNSETANDSASQNNQADEKQSSAESSTKITIKGNPSTTTDAETPEIYVDGKLFEGDLNNISPDAIESMRIVKDKAPAQIHITLKKGEKALKAAETMPQFPGGEMAMMQWLMQNIKYPDIPEAEMPEKLRVIAEFVIDTDGHTTDVQIKRGGPEAFNEEAKRVILAMPAFEPGTKDGKPVKVTYTLPINFSAVKSAPKNDAAK